MRLHGAPGHKSRNAGRMYAITFDLDPATLERSYGDASRRNAFFVAPAIDQASRR